MPKQGINFAKQTAAYREGQKQQAFLKNAIFALVILGLSFASYGGAYLYKTYQTGRIDKIKSQIEQVKANRNYNEIAQTLDTSSRLNFVRDISYKQIYWSGFLKQLEDNLLPVVFLESMNGKSNFTPSEQGLEANLGNQEQGNEVVLEMVAPNLSDIAKQIDVLQKMDNVGNVKIDGVDKDEIGLKFSLNLQLTPDGLQRFFYTQEEESQNELRPANIQQTDQAIQDESPPEN
ncbi:MAG: hypothetical protein GF335_01380 [Candidatus Moranbacteria bacterium]|nr:hypothetical protein [Candidatus Moranbacteria bacterium]